MKRLRFPILVIFLISYMFVLTSCSDKSGDIAILSDSDVFQASSLNNKIDILWMIDSSGSMQEEQDNLATNFNAFINDFVTKGYDYNIAVGATDAWRYEFNPASTTFQNLVKFRDGNIYTGSTADNSGVFMISTLTPDIIPTFNKNVKVGITGNGDERAFESIRQSLLAPMNSGFNFRRSDAYLAIIIVSDEEDFSRDDSTLDPCTATPLPATCQDLRPISEYTGFLDSYTSSTPADRKYGVSAIGVFDSACLTEAGASDHMGERYAELAVETNGVTGSICDDDFSPTLDAIQAHISEESTQFRLSRIPVVSSIVVRINSVLIPQDATNGWTYVAASNSIKFHGTAIPAQGASIQVLFDPTTLN
ncbi:MAG: hypothetical protein V4596_03895 [Bdellovibrionota bacterium]